MKQFSSLLTQLAGLNKKLFSLLLLTTLSCAMTWGQTTVTQSSFSATNGNLNGDANITYTSYQGSGTAAPAIKDGAIRLYQNNAGYTGGYIVIAAKNNCTISSVSITSAMNTTTGYYLSETAPTTTPAKNDFQVSNYSLSANGTYTVSDLNTPCITFACFGKSSGTRLYISKISVTYTSAPSKTLTHISAASEDITQQVYEKFTPPTIIASYSDGTTAEVTNLCTFTVTDYNDINEAIDTDTYLFKYDNTSTGNSKELLVTATYEENGNPQTTPYTLTIPHIDCTTSGLQLSVSNLTTNSATLEWTAVNGATGYMLTLLDMMLEGEAAMIIYKEVPAGTTSYNATNLDNSTLYGYAVRPLSTNTLYCDESYDLTLAHTLTIKAGTGGSVSPTAAQVLAPEATSTDITATSDKGYKFKEWTITGNATITSPTEAITTVTMGEEDATLTAIFESLPEHTLTVNCNPTDAGSVNPTTKQVIEQLTTTVTATPNEGYTFSGWTLSGTGASISSNTATTTTLTMGTADATLTANFTKKPTYTITAQTNDNTMGTAAASPASGYAGDKITLTATPNTGYQFVSWIVNSGNVTLADANQPTTTFTLGTENVSVTATFEKIPTYQFTVYVNDDAITDTQYQEGATINQPTNPTSSDCDGSKVFVGWTTTPIETETNTEPTLYTIPETMPKQPITVYAVFATETTSGGGETTYTYKFNETDFDTWEGSYSKHEFTFSDGAKVVFDKANKNSSTIKDIPVTKGSNVTFYAPSSNTITALTFTCRQWNTKIQTITLYTSTDGSTFTNTKITSTDFSLEATNLTNTQTVQFHFSSADNQIGIESLQVTYGGSSTTRSAYTTTCTPCTDPATPLSITAEATTLDLTGGTATTQITPTGGNGKTITYTCSPTEGANITPDGTFTATADGTYTITASQERKDNGDDTFTCAQTAETTITVNKEKFTVTFNNNGIEHDKQTITDGEKATLPTNNPTSCEDYTFVGWTTTQQTEELTTQPTLFNFSTPITDNTTLYAVYSKEEGRVQEDIIFDPNDITNLTDNGSYSWTHTSSGTVFSIKSGQHYTSNSPKTFSINNGSSFTITAPSLIERVEVELSTATYKIASVSPGTLSTNSTKQTINNINAATITGEAANKQQIRITRMQVFLQQSLLYTTSPVCGPKISAKGNVRATSAQGIGVEAQDNIAVQAIRLTNADGKIANKLWISNISNPAFTARFVNETAYTNGQSNINTDEATATRNAQIVVTYTPTVANTTEEAVITITAENRSLADDKKVFATTDITVRGRSLPQQFAIVAEVNGAWYALPNNMSAADTYGGLPVEIAADAIATAPVQAVYHAFAASTATSYTSLPNHKTLLRFGLEEANGLWLGTSTGIKNGTKSTNTLWQLQPQDDTFSEYQLYAAEAKKPVGINTGNTAAAKRWGAYATACNYTVRLLPINATCYYAPAPELVATDIKATEATITTTMPAGYTQFEIAEWEYSLDQNNWTNIGASPFTVTGLQSGTDNTIYVRAYAAADNCAATGSVVVTTADCDDVPVSLAATATMDKVNISWQCTAPTATVRIYSDEQLTTSVAELTNATSPCEIGGLKANTTYYYKVLADGTCASATAQFTTQSPHIEIVEWAPEAVTIEMNIDGAAQVEIQKQVEHGSEQTNVANDLFISKYFEANGTAKMLAVYNGTTESIPLTDIALNQRQYTFPLSGYGGGADKNVIEPNEEIIIFTEDQNGTKVNECMKKEEGYDKWHNLGIISGIGHVFQFSGTGTIYLTRGETIIDIVGATKTRDASYPIKGTTEWAEASETPIFGTTTTETGEVITEKGDGGGFNCKAGDNIQTEEIESDYVLSTNRCLLVRKNHVKDGSNAVFLNDNAFVTLCDEWTGLQIPKDGSADKGVTESCEGMAYVGEFNYSSYYKSFETFVSSNDLDGYKNHDGTYTIPVPELHTLACTPLRIKIFNKERAQQLAQVEQKVPIMVQQPNTTTDDDIFKGEKFGAEVCKTCDVVILPAADLSISTAATAINEVRSIDIYPGAELIVPTNAEYTAKVVAFRSKDSKISSAKIDGTLTLNSTAANKVYHDKRITATQWYWFCLPYDCRISDITLRSGLPLVYNVDYQIQQYNGEARAEAAKEHPITATENFWEPLTADATLLAGKGYAIGLDDARMTAGHTYKDVRFPMTGINENQNKTTTVGAWGIDAIEQVRPNNAGWNLIGNPFVSYYRSADYNGLQNGNLIRNGLVDKDGTPIVKFEWDGNTTPYITQTTDNGRTYTQADITQTDLSPFLPHFVQVASGTALQFAADSRKQLLSPLHTPSAEADAPVRVQLVLTDQKQHSDLTGLVISNRYTATYEVGADLYKWRGSGYKLTDKPVVATRSGNDELAFHALSDHDATAPVGINYFVRTEGDYTFTLNRTPDMDKVKSVYLYDALTMTHHDLLSADYRFHTTAGDNRTRFFVSIIVDRAPIQTGTEQTNGNATYASSSGRTISLWQLPAEATVWVYDAAGRLIANEHTHNLNRHYTVGAAGIYNIRIESAEGNTVLQTIVK